MPVLRREAQARGAHVVAQADVHARGAQQDLQGVVLPFGARVVQRGLAVLVLEAHLEKHGERV